MSKKSSTFVPEMRKKQYIYPVIEVVKIETGCVMGLPGSKGSYGGAPRRRETEVF